MLFIQSFIIVITIIKTSLIDHTSLLQQLLDKNAGKIVTFPAGEFMVGTLNVSENTWLKIGAKTILKGIPTDHPIPILKLSTGVQISGTGIIDGNRLQRKIGTGIQLFDCQKVQISGLHIREVAEQAIMIARCKKVTLINLQINGCGLKGVEQSQGINIVTSKNIQVYKCHIEKVQHGIQWWGDDINGWCENLKIIGNQARNIDGGGIWGNRGRNVIITDNVTENCGDVGIDFEHSSSCTAANNTVRNCKNYALAIFNGSYNINFTNNKVFQGENYGHGIGLIGDELSKQISFVNGTINTKGVNACGLITVGTNVAQDVLIKNYRIVTEGKNGIPIRIVDNNQFQIINNPVISGIGATGISLEGSSRSVINDNIILHNGPDVSKLMDRGGIFVYFRSAEYPAQYNQVQRNTIRGYKTGINDECWGNVNSNNLYEQNVTPNLVHRTANGTWGGKSIQNYTKDRKNSPLIVKQ